MCTLLWLNKMKNIPKEVTYRKLNMTWTITTFQVHTFGTGLKKKEIKTKPTLTLFLSPETCLQENSFVHREIE